MHVCVSAHMGPRRNSLPFCFIFPPYFCATELYFNPSWHTHTLDRLSLKGKTNRFFTIFLMNITDECISTLTFNPQCSLFHLEMRRRRHVYMANGRIERQDINIDDQKRSCGYIGIFLQKTQKCEHDQTIELTNNVHINIKRLVVVRDLL